MFCESCGKELREGAKYCPGCGKSIAEEKKEQTANVTPQGTGKLIVYGYTEKYAIRPKVDIWKNGIKIAEVYPDSMIELPIDENCTIQFKCMLRTATLPAFAGQIKTIRLSFNRVTGELLINAPGQVPVAYSSDNRVANSQAGTVAPYAGGEEKNKVVAALLGILLGGFGAHKFYMGDIKLGIVYLLFCWTYIPSILGLIEGIIYLTETDEQFNNRWKIS